MFFSVVYFILKVKETKRDLYFDKELLPIHIIKDECYVMIPTLQEPDIIDESNYCVEKTRS